MRNGWRKWTESCHKILFQSQSICDRNTCMGAEDLCDEAPNRSNVFRWYSRFWDGRELVDDDDERCGCPLLTRTEVNIAAVADLVKNDHWITSRMTAESLNIPKTSCSDSERGFGNEKVECTFCSALLDTWAKGRSSNILPRYYCDGRCRQKFF